MLGQIAYLCIWQQHLSVSATGPITCGYSMPQEPELPTWGFGQTESGTTPSHCGSLGQWGLQHTYGLLNCPKQKTKGWDSGSWKFNQFLARPRIPQKWVLVPGSLFPKNRQATGMSRTLCQGLLKPPACQGSSQTDHTGVAGPRLAPRHCQVCHDPHCSQESETLRSPSHA